MPKYITTAEAAARNGLSVGRIVQLCSAGEIKGATKFGRVWQVPELWKWKPTKPGPKPVSKR
jgi:hypothetical protein